MKKLLLLITIILAGFTTSQASHLMGGEITYTYVGGNDYQVTLIVYRDCFGINVSTNQTVTFESASCGQDFNVVIPFLQVVDISQVCPGQATTCNGGTTPGTEQHVFQGIVTLTPCADWIMHWNQGTRNAAIQNLVAPSTENIYIQNTLNNIIGANNNSPQFFASPTPYLCANNLAIYSHAAADPDGDSLYYSFNTPLGTPGPPGTPIAFAAGYTLNDPLTTTAGINFDQVTGEMCFTPDVGQIVVISVLVQEYRNGILIGSQIREMQVVVDPACTNSNPTTGVAATCGGAAALNLTVAGPSVTQVDANSVVMCPDDNVCFEVSFSDPDGDNITVNSPNIAIAMPTATFTVIGNGTPNPIGTFCWTPTPLDSGLNVFAIIATDDACPIIGTQTFVIDITVFDEPYAGLDDTICGDQEAQLQASGGAGYSWSVITGDPIIVGTNFSCVNCDDPLASPSVTTTYLLTSNLAAACNNTDTVTIMVVPDIIPTALGDTALCDFLAHPIDVSVTPAGGYTYLWSPAATLTNPNIANPIANPTQTTPYVVTVSSALGCVKTDTTTIIVTPPPSVTLIPGDTTICTGDPLQFDVSLAALEDNFNAGFDATIWGTVSRATVGNPCLPYSGTALNFDGGNRELTTNSLSVTNCTSIDFCLWIANNSSAGAGCENADAGEDVVINYSINGPGGPWITLQTYTTGDWDTGGPYANAWQCFSVAIPLAAQTGNTMFQWEQIGGYGGTLDNWALDDISISCGGSTNYSYDWSSPASLDDPFINNPIATVNTTTTYTVTLTDLASGCSLDRFQTITVVPSYTISTTQSDTNICLAETVDFTVTESIVGAFTYSWAPSGIMNTPTGATTTGLFNTPGANTIFVTVDNGGGCIKTDTMTVNVAAAVTPDINILTPDSLIDCGDSVLVDLDLGGGVPASCGLSATNACSGPTTQSFIGLGTTNISNAPSPYYGFYEDGRVQMIYTAAELNAMGFMGGKITEIAFNITNLASSQNYDGFNIKMGCTATSDFNGITTFEAGLSQVYSNASYASVLGWNIHTLDAAYEWDGLSNLIVEVCFDNSSWTSTDAVAQTNMPNQMTLADWTDGAAGCTLNTPNAYNERPDIAITHCPTIPDPAAFTYSWVPNTEITTANIQNPYLHPEVPTTYEVTVSDLTGSCFDTDTIHIQVQCPTCDQPGITLINPTCNGGTNGKIIVDPTFQFGSEQHTYTYTDSISNIVLQTSTNIIAGMQDSLINIGAGAYTISLLDTNGCTKDTTVWLTEPDSVEINFTTEDDIICINGATQIDATASGPNGGPYTYTWTDLTSNTSFAAISGPQTVSPTDSTCYSVFATDQLGCITNDDSIVCIDLYPPIIASTLNADTTICQGDTVSIDMGAIGGSGTGYQYEWFENGISIGFGAIINVEPSSSPTTYTGVARDDCTTPPDNINVTVNWPGTVFPSFLKNRLDSCYNDTPVEFTDYSTPSAIIQSIDWSTSNGNSGSGAAGSTFSSVFNAPGCNDITLTVHTIHGCHADTTYQCYVNPRSYPVANFDMTPPVTDLFNTEIDFNNLSYGTDPLTYEWNFNNGASSTTTEENPIYTFPDDSARNYPISLIVTDSNGCVATANGTVVINSIYLFYLPTSFTPNGDGLNDEFRAYGEGIDLENFTMYIFNRWGELMFQTENIGNGWDGTYKGKIVEAGTYVWKVVSKEDAGTIVHDRFGKITITK